MIICELDETRLAQILLPPPRCQLMVSRPWTEFAWRAGRAGCWWDWWVILWRDDDYCLLPLPIAPPVSLSRLPCQPAVPLATAVRYL